jgi:hypothetical protein
MGLRGSMRLAQWLLDLESERLSHISWIEAELGKRFGVVSIGGSGYSMGLAAGMFFGSVLPEAHFSTVRAIKERIEYGDSISIGTVNSLVNFMGGDDDRELVNASLRCAPLVISPMTTESEIKFAVEGLNKYPGLFKELTGERWRENGKLLIEAALYVFDNIGTEDGLTIEDNDKGLWKSFSFASEATAALILSHPDKLDDIISIMEARRTVDAELIASVLDADAQALSNGAL